MLVVDLREAGGELAGAGAGGRNHHERTGGLHVLVLAVALVGDDEVHVVGVALDGVVQAALDAQARQAVAEGVGRGLAGVLGDDHGRHGHAVAAEEVHQAQDVLVVGDAEVSAGLVLLDVVGVDGDDDLDVVRDALEHAELGVGLKAGKDAGGVVVVKELAAKLQVELAAKLSDALANMLRLQLDVLVVVKACAQGCPLVVPSVWKASV